MSLIEKVQQKYSNKKDRDLSFEIIGGAFCLMIGLILIIMRGQIAMEAVGTEQIFVDVFSGKGISSFNTALMTVIIIASLILVTGAIMLFFAITAFPINRWVWEMQLTTILRFRK